jgi:alkylresorcinol/alkylpyrone synthase
MSVIVGFGTAVPAFGIDQMKIHAFMDNVFTGDDNERRRLKLLYERSGISRRYAAIPDYDIAAERHLYPGTPDLEPFPSLEQRMKIYRQSAAPLAEQAIHNLTGNTTANLDGITHLVTVSCTGMSAPGLDLELVERLGLPKHVHRTSVNFMGCYAAVHALKMADAFCNSSPNAKVLVVCVELCTLHFQKKQDYDNLTANAIFGDGAAACLVVSNELKETYAGKQFSINNFYAEVQAGGKNDMAWELSSSGFLMTLSAYIPQLVEANMEELLHNALRAAGMKRKEIGAWAIHPGGRKILEAVSARLGLEREALRHAYTVLNDYGNMSSATILFVLQRVLADETLSGNIFGAAFGPGLTMETFLLHKS